VRIWVDADACPRVIKDILFRAAERTGVSLTLVANQSIKTPPFPHIRSLQVSAGFDVADNEIVKRVQPGDLVGVDLCMDTGRAEFIVNGRGLGHAFWDLRIAAAQNAAPPPAVSIVAEAEAPEPETPPPPEQADDHASESPSNDVQSPADALDDVVSLVYVLLERRHGFLPWDRVMKPRKDLVLESFYPGDPLCNIEQLCRGNLTREDLYAEVFLALGM
jgi:hypothetical protein